MKRFLNADSYGSTGQGFLGYNMFAYCNNNPANSKDPSGLVRISTVPMMCTDGETNYYYGQSAISNEDRAIIDMIEDQGHYVLRYNSRIDSVEIAEQVFSYHEKSFWEESSDFLMRNGIETLAEGVAAELICGGIFWKEAALYVGCNFLSHLLFPGEDLPYRDGVNYNQYVITVNGHVKNWDGTITHYKESFVFSRIKADVDCNEFSETYYLHDHSFFEFNIWG